MNKILKFKVKIKGCTETFIEGEDPGVISLKEYEIKVSDEEEQKWSFVNYVMRQKQEIIDEVIDVEVEKWNEE